MLSSVGYIVKRAQGISTYRRLGAAVIGIHRQQEEKTRNSGREVVR
jgi:hypothetical protein